MQSLASKGISEDVISCLLKDVTGSSIKKYQSYWSGFARWCHGREIGPGSLSVNIFCKYLIFMFSDVPTGRIGSDESLRSALFGLIESHQLSWSGKLSLP